MLQIFLNISSSSGFKFQVYDAKSCFGFSRDPFHGLNKSPSFYPGNCAAYRNDLAHNPLHGYRECVAIRGLPCINKKFP